MSRRKRALVAALLGLALIGAAVSGAAFVASSSDATNNLGAAADWVPPSVSAATISPTSSGTPTGTDGFLKQGGSYRIYANVDDTTSGVGTVTADLTNVSGSGANAVPLVAGSYTVGSTTYNYASAEQTASDPLTEGSESYLVTAGDNADNTTTSSAFTVTVDNTAPSVASIVRHDASPTNGSSVQFDVTFNEPVSGVDAGDFAVAATGAIGASVTGVSGSGTDYTVTVDTGSGDGSVGLNLADDDSILDRATNPLGGAGAGDGNFTGQTYAIDKTAPAVQSIDRHDASPTNASSVQFDVTFSEPVTGADAGDFAVAGSGVTGASITGVTGSGTNYTVTVDTGSGDGSVGLNLADDDSITDSASNELGGTGAGNGDFTGQLYAIDRTAPTVSSIDRAQSDPTSAATRQWTVTFDKSVTGVDATDFAVAQTGGVSGASVTGVSGSGTTYTVTANTGSGNGSLGLNLADDDSVVDSASNKLGGTGAGNGDFTGQLYTIDKIAPTVSSIDRAQSDPTNATTRQWTVTFGKSVTGVDATDFAVAQTGGVSGASVTGVSGSGTTYTVTANTGSGDGSLGLNLVDDDSVVDSAGNKLGGTGAGNGNFTGQLYAIDKTPPTVTASVVSATSSGTPFGPGGFVKQGGTYKVYANITDAGSGVASATASVTNVTTGASSVALTLDSTGVSVGGTTYHYISAEQTANGALTAGAKNYTVTPTDNAQNTGSGTTFSVTVDNTPPTVSSIIRAQSDPTNATTRQWTVTFGKSVTGVDATDFAVAQTGGVSGASVTGVSGSGTTYTVTANTGSGTGSLGLNLVDDDSVLDSAGNKLGGTGAGNGNFTGQLYAIDKTAPTVTNLQLVNKSGGIAGRVEAGDSVVATYSEALHVNSLCSTWLSTGDASNQSLNGSNDVTVTVNNNAGTGGVDTLTVSSASSTLHLGTIELGSSSYVSGNVTFSGSGGSKSTIAWDATNHTLTILFGAQGGAGTASTVASSIGKLTPDSAATDPAGNALTGTFSTANIQQF